MEFLKNLALPQATEHVHLLLFMMNLVFILLIPYFGFLLGCAGLSILKDRRARRTGDTEALRFARDLINTAVFSKSVVTFLGVLPALTMVLLLAQLHQSTPAIATSLMGFAFLALLAGAVLLYAYGYTFRLSGLLRSVASTAGGPAGLQIGKYLETHEVSHLRTGRWGFGLAFVAAFLLSGALTVAANPVIWGEIGSVFDLILLPEFWLRYGQFLSIGCGATGVGILFFFFSWQGGFADPADSYGRMVIRVAVRITGFSFLLLPLFIIGTVALTPAQGLSGVVFGLAALSLLLIFIAGHFVYAYWKERREGYVAYAFYAMGVALVLLMTKDQVTISNATQEHALALASIAEKETDALKSRLGIAAAALTGQDIYSGRCSACHLFDQKKVGPPYREVIPKYEGRKSQLIAFVLNPVKVDPAYPNMPNQGLKANEADSIATFLLSKYSGGPSPQPPQQGSVK